MLLHEKFREKVKLQETDKHSSISKQNNQKKKSLSIDCFDFDNGEHVHKMLHLKARFPYVQYFDETKFLLHFLFNSDRSSKFALVDFSKLKAGKLQE